MMRVLRGFDGVRPADNCDHRSHCLQGRLDAADHSLNAPYATRNPPASRNKRRRAPDPPPRTVSQFGPDMASIRAAKDGYELAGQSTDGTRRGSREQSPDAAKPPRRLDEGLSDDDDEIEQLLSTGNGRLSVGDDRTDDGKEEGMTGGDSSEEPDAELRASSAAGSEEKSVLTRVTGGMTARQRRVFTAEMLREVCTDLAASVCDLVDETDGCMLNADAASFAPHSLYVDPHRRTATACPSQSYRATVP